MVLTISSSQERVQQVLSWKCYACSEEVQARMDLYLLSFRHFLKFRHVLAKPFATMLRGERKG